MGKTTIPTYDHFKAHISEETEKARVETEQKIADPAVTDVRCVDGLTSKGNWNPPGGGVFLLNEGLLEEFVSIRAAAGITDGILGDHDYCGYKRVIMGLQTLDEHRQVLKRLRNEVDRLNKRYHTRFKVLTEKNGSAKPYMR